MALLIDHQPISVNPGTRQFEAAVDAPGRIVVRLARQTTAEPALWADGVEVSLNVEVSDDNGSTWRNLVAFTAHGGIYVGRDGEAAESFVDCPFPAVTNRTRLTATVSGGTLVTRLTVERV